MLDVFSKASTGTTSYFLDEITILAFQMQTPNIIKLHFVGEKAGEPIMSMATQIRRAV